MRKRPLPRKPGLKLDRERSDALKENTAVERRQAKRAPPSTLPRPQGAEGSVPRLSAFRFPFFRDP